MKKIAPIFLSFSLVLNFAIAQNTDVLLQGFNWESHTNTQGWHNVIGSKAADLQAAQIDMVWFPPASKSAAPQGYLPNELYDLNTQYGSQAELQAAIQALHNHNIKAIADIVINHRVGTADWADFTNPTWGCWAVTADDEWGQNGGNPCGDWDTGDPYAAARDVNHANSQVQNDIKAWMNWLKNTIGFDGWRYDYTKGYSGYYNGIYNDATSPYFSVGELWDNLDEYNPDPHRQQIIDWINAANQTSTSFDFTTKGVLQRAFYDNNLGLLNRNNQAPGVIGWWPEQAVTFLDNHDTGSTQAHWPFPGAKVMAGYAYILTHPGIPMVFWDHFYEWGLHDEIKALIALRKANGIHSGSTLSIQQVQNNLYSAIIDGKVAMKIGGGNWSPSGTGWQLKASGNDYAVWDKETTVDTEAPTLSANPNSGIVTSNTNVTISASDNMDPSPRLYYTTDGSTPIQNLSSSAISSFVITPVSGTTIVKVLAEDASGNESDVETFEYTVGPQPTMTVYLKTNWPNPTIYFWGVESAGNNPTPVWPGEAMTDVGDGWYAYTLEGSCTDLIFSNSGGSQTDDLNACGNSWYDNGWGPEPGDNQAPTVTVNPSGGNYPSGSVTVSISISDNVDTAPVFYYTTDGSEPSLSSSNSSNTVNLTFTENTTLKVFGVDAAGNTSDPQTHDYTFGPGPNGFTVYFKSPTSWNQVKIHHWNALPTGSLASTTWPGADMTDEGDGWYSYFFAGIESTSMLFHNNAGDQTIDLSRNSDGWYMDGTWYGSDPTEPAGDMTVFFKPSGYSNPSIYFWGATPSNLTTSWPGEAMTNEGGGWYSYTLSETNCTNLIFSNNGASQTLDLYRCGDGWHQNGQWSDNQSRVGYFEEKQINLSAIPNPASTKTTVSFFLLKDNEVAITLLDMMGRVIKRPISNFLWKGPHEFSIDLEQLPTGIYNCMVKIGGNTMMQKISVIH